jgi:hypothetical protein
VQERKKLCPDWPTWSQVEIDVWVHGAQPQARLHGHMCKFCSTLSTIFFLMIFSKQKEVKATKTA